MELTEDTRKRAARVRDSQLNVMINYMVDHRDFASGRFQGPQGKVTAERQWQQLAELLAGHGPNKSVVQWKKVWKDLKGKARARNARINADRGRTGNVTVGPESELSDIDRKVLGIIGTQTSIPLFDGGMHHDTVSDDAECSLNIELEEPIIEIVAGEITLSTEDGMNVVPCSTSNGTVGEKVTPPQKGSCPPNRSSLLKELEAVSEKVEKYEDRHLQLLKDIKEAIIGLQREQSLLVEETHHIAGSMRELVATNYRIAAALENLTGSASGQT